MTTAAQSAAASSVPAPAAPSGECLVCGGPATLRCSTCFAKSNIVITFCSMEHQRLIWLGHRLVCGENAHPYSLPPFSKQEADAVEAFISCAPDIKAECESAAKKTPLLQPAELVGKRGATTSRDVDSAPTERTIRFHRRLLFRRWARLSTGLTLSPEDVVAGLDRGLDQMQECLTASPPNSLWHSLVCHQLLVNEILLRRLDLQVEDRVRQSRPTLTASHSCAAVWTEMDRIRSASPDEIGADPLTKLAVNAPNLTWMRLGRAATDDEKVFATAARERTLQKVVARNREKVKFCASLV